MLFDLGRSFARLPSIPSGDDDGGAARRSSVQVCLAVVSGQDAGVDVTVGWLAGALGIEASTASRLVTQAVAAQLVRSSPAPSDRRRLVLDLTASGIRLAHDARQYQRQVFEEVTSDWDSGEREAFARRFVGFAAAVIARTAVERSPGR